MIYDWAGNNINIPAINAHFMQIDQRQGLIYLKRERSDRSDV